MPQDTGPDCWLKALSAAVRLLADKRRAGDLPAMGGLGSGGIARSVVVLATALLLLTVSIARAGEDPPPQEASSDLTELSLEQLANVEVVTVAKRPEKSFETAAPVYVITQEDIRRSGVTSLPEALRLSPGVEVARIDSNKWAIGVRGFASRLSRSVLGLMDGRSVYTPLFAGVYWEVQDSLLEDVDRIEVVRGPSGTLWGTHATNGVINVITKPARETQGLLATTGGGNFEQGFTGFRYGGRRGKEFFYRIYGKLFSRGPGFHADGDDFDDWRMGQAGFRADWNDGGKNTYKLQGDFYEGEAGQRARFTRLEPPSLVVVRANSHLAGGNVLGQWGHDFTSTSNSTLRVYYDRVNHHEPTFQEVRDTFDVEFSHHFAPSSRHSLNWGFSYDLTSGDFAGVPTIVFLPHRRTDQLLSGFIQDEIALLQDRVRLTLASRADHNDYSGFEIQPSARVLWRLASRQALWLAFSRAVRTPSRVEQDLTLTSLLDPGVPAFVRAVENKDFQPEKQLAYEAGYRMRPLSQILITLAAFFNDYDDLLSIEVVGAPFVEVSPLPLHVVLPLQFRNGLHGSAHGLELTGDWAVTERWRVSGSYSHLRIDLTRDPAGADVSGERSVEGSSPRQQVSLRSFLNLAAGLELDWLFRYVSGLPSQNVGGYATSDVRLGWRPTAQLEFSLVGQNLHQAHHAEFAGGQPNSVEVRRSAYGRVTWRW